ncbi:MAG TPA: PKD domain-containing protein, partial [Candidatus Saccharimonadales bacterium]|nr:PKD domain-containing protein [Candidatus Saccharimonadales bacterium]
MRQATKRISLTLSSLLISAGLWPVAVLAHSQNSTPYLRVNGQFVETNPLAEIAPSQVPSDQAPELYPVGEPIEFAVDLNVIRQQSQFRWQWREGDMDYQVGTSVRHSYDKTGSYTVTLQAKNDTISERFIDYDRLRVNVVPKPGYVMP